RLADVPVRKVLKRWKLAKRSSTLSVRVPDSELALGVMLLLSCTSAEAIGSYCAWLRRIPSPWRIGSSRCAAMPGLFSSASAIASLSVTDSTCSSWVIGRGSVSAGLGGTLGCHWRRISVAPHHVDEDAGGGAGAVHATLPDAARNTVATSVRAGDMACG